MKQKSVSGDKQVVYAIRRLKNIWFGGWRLRRVWPLLTAFAGPVSARMRWSIPRTKLQKWWQPRQMKQALLHQM